MEFTLLGAAAVGVAAMWLWTRLDRALESSRDPFGVLLGAALVGLMIGRVTAMVATGTNPISFDVVLVRGGVSTVGASVGALLWLGWRVRDDLAQADLLAPAGLAGLAGWHMGCVVRSSCLGAATDLPWGWSLPGSPVDRHPVEIYAGLALLAGAVLAAVIRSKRPTSGVTALVAIGMAGSARLATEPLRLTLGELRWFYVLAAAVGYLGALAVGLHDARHDR